MLEENRVKRTLYFFIIILLVSCDSGSIIDALKTENADKAMKLISTDKQINKCDENGKTALFIAVDKGYYNIVKALIEAGADINIRDNHKKTVLIVALNQQNEKIAQLLLSSGADCNVLDGEDNTMLTLALKHKQFNIAQNLLPKVDIDHQNLQRETALMIAARNDNEKITELLVELGADVNIEAYRKNTALIIAAKSNSPKSLKILLPKSKINHPNIHNDTALIIAIKKGYVEIVKILMAFGASTSAGDDRFSCFTYAKNNKEILELIAGDAAKKKPFDPKVWDVCWNGQYFEFQNYQWQILDTNKKIKYAHLYQKWYAIKNNLPLEKIIKIKRNRCVFVLVPPGVYNGYNIDCFWMMKHEFGVTKRNPYGLSEISWNDIYKKYIKSANINLPTSKQWMFACFAAGVQEFTQGKWKSRSGFGMYNMIGGVRGEWCENWHHNFREFKVIRNPQINGLQPQDSEYNLGFRLIYKEIIPMILAVKENNIEQLDTLLIKKANGNTTDSAGWTSLMHACRLGRTKMVKKLIAAKVNVRAKENIHGVTALMLACENGHQKIVDLLLTANAQVNLQDKDCITPLMFACKGGHQNIVNLLLKKGANINAKDEGHWTPLIYAAIDGYTEVVKTLVANNAETKTKDLFLNTAFDYAKASEYKEIMALLQQKQE
ncbi:ankyrin repeat domain-containing protein [Candidatus Uabimicrobium sp. HlEnr_7]|uniref:ankyrin repeat domain-containing protein n=1 Tax=Candidatus Uabimicrobium helgolandensis TaxID=3095367 RepID=UPI0035561167